MAGSATRGWLVAADGDTDGAAAATIDPDAMPRPAVAEVEVDGTTITYRPNDPEDTRLFTCDLGADRVTVNMQTPEGQDLLVQLATLDSDQWAGSLAAKDRASDRNYQGDLPYEGGAVAVSGPHLVVVGPFTYYPTGDPLDVTDVGDATIAVTCP